MIQVLDTKTLEMHINAQDLSIENANTILTMLKDASKTNDKDITLDFAKVINIDSSAIAMLVKFVQFLSQSKRTVYINHLTPELLEIFQMVKLTHFFKFEGNASHPHPGT